MPPDEAQVGLFCQIICQFLPDCNKSPQQWRMMVAHVARLSYHTQWPWVRFSLNAPETFHKEPLEVSKRIKLLRFELMTS